MNLIINKTNLFHGDVTPPSSKSHSIRAIFLSTLNEGKSILKNILHSEDTRHAIHVCTHLGAKIEESASELVIRSSGLPLEMSKGEINSGNSGITTCFVMPILGLRKNTASPIILNCGEQMRTRPIKPLVEALLNLGMNIRYLEDEGRLPVSIVGELVGGKTEIEGMTSQYLSALLIALPCAKIDSEIKVKDLHERSYVEMTLNWLKQQGIQFNHEPQKNNDIYLIKGQQKYKNIHITISPDFSSASYLIAAAVLIPGKVILKGLNMADAQGDKRLLSILQEMGADIIIKPEELFIYGGKKLSGIKINANDIPDLLPTLAVLGTYAAGKTEIYNVRQARIKETDRIHSMSEGLARLGAKIDKYEDGLTIHQSRLTGEKVKGYGDHRTVMALAIAGMVAEGVTIIEDGESINKTFPMFVQTMQSLGAKIRIENAPSA
ncbi:MAG: 3-phosphoshikimate 1-carboxyvinyltransferase [Gammaproteobacteria bacterium]|jgi:3-phosphoshikimate 1-carboxyvinyltransferase|nr:3-phosphoshikimate 1-carboxyvinyltransferase [Gammaproteobacteria bacterium]